MTNLRDFYLLDPDVVFLNHGSFGATPRPVFDTYQDWQRRMERQPVRFLAHELGDHLAVAREALARLIHTRPDDLVYVPNVTFGINIVARSLALGPGDELLTTNHEYGACDRTWQYMSLQRGFDIVRRPVALPLTSAESIVEQLWQGVTPSTRVIFISHITSPTAVCFPVAAICERARSEGIVTIIDGAHAPGQVSLDMDEIGADFYGGNCHKWLSSPKGAGFLHARPEVQHLIEPLVVGWGWGDERPLSFGSDFLDYLQYTGTDDYAAYLSVPAAIQFQKDHDWEIVRGRCHALAAEAIGRIDQLTGRSSIYPPGDDLFYRQMATAEVPPIDDLRIFQQQLYDDFCVEIPCVEWEGRQFIRVSVQAYNTKADIDVLLAALEAVLPQHTIIAG